MRSNARTASTRAYVQTHTLTHAHTAETGHGRSLPDASNVGDAVVGDEVVGDAVGDAVVGDAVGGAVVGDRVGDAVGAKVGGFVSPRFVGEKVPVITQTGCLSAAAAPVACPLKYT